MRDLILMRGAPGSGKSTWIAQNGLEWYTIASDNVRMMWSQPVPEPVTGEPTIRLWNENQVWDNIEAMIEYRMKNGQFIVLDALMNNFDASWKEAWGHDKETLLGDDGERVTDLCRPFREETK